MIKFSDEKNRIKECREKIGLTQKDLGDMIPVTNVTINKYEHGHPFTIETSKKLAAALKVDYRYLTGEVDFPNWKDYLEDEKKKDLIKRNALLDLLDCMGFSVFESDYKIKESYTIDYMNNYNVLCPSDNSPYKIYEVYTKDHKIMILNERDLIQFEKMIKAAFNSLLEDIDSYNDFTEEN